MSCTEEAVYDFLNPVPEFVTGWAAEYVMGRALDLRGVSKQAAARVSRAAGQIVRKYVKAVGTVQFLEDLCTCYKELDRPR
jgi:hypothetical protein